MINGRMETMKGLSISKLLTILVRIILPARIANAILNRVERTKRVMTSTKELRIFFKILFLPLEILAALIVAVFKTIAIWLIPTTVYGNLKFVFNQFYNDVNVKKIGVGLAWKRVKLCWELFTKGAEKKVSYGDKNPDLTFYVIRPYYFLEPNEFIYRNVANLLTQYYYALQKLSYAVENKWIPVIDWQNYGMMPHAENYAVNGTTNSWEYYWSQPSEYSLEEVYQSKNVILSTRNIGQYGYIPNCAMQPPFSKYATNLADKCPQYAQLIPLNEITQQYVNEAYKKLFPEEKRVLGVVVRGASYGRVGTPNHSHPKQASMNELINSVKRYCEEWNMEYVFFVNEMEELVDVMKNEFGDKLIVLPRQRDHLDRPADGITENPLYADGCRYQTNLDYVTEVALLSKCNALLGSMSSGARTALIWNDNNYEHVYMVEKGLW